MTNNKGLIITIIAVVIVLLAVGGWMMYGANNQASQNNQNSNTNTNNQNTVKGTMYFAFTDAAVNMANVSAVNMTVDKVYMHSQAQGWITLSNTPQTFSLLALKQSGKAGLFIKANLAVDTYDQIWFHTTKMMVTESGTVKEAELPASDFKMSAVVKVLANSNSTAVVDVLADQSLHKTDKGEFIFAPVVKFESRSNASVTVDSNNLIDVSNGTVDSSINAGMDINGEVKTNFKLDIGSNLHINGGVIKVK